VDAVMRDITGNRLVLAQPRKFCPNAFD